MEAPSTGSFSDLGLSEPVLAAISALGELRPTRFQSVTIPPLLEGRDLLGSPDSPDEAAAAFTIPVIERVLRDGPAYNPTAVILSPSRERAIEVHEAVFRYSSRGSTARVLGAFEGKPVTSQIGPLKHGTDIVAGTPGRVLEHVRRRTLRIEQLKILVIDGADAIFEEGLDGEVAEIIDATPKTRQTIMLTGSTPTRVLAMARRQLRDPELAGVAREDLESVEAPAQPPGRMVNLYFGVGSKAGITPRDLVGAITSEGGLGGEQIGEVSIKANFSLVAVPASAAANVARKMKSSLVKGRKAKIRLERFQKPSSQGPRVP